MTGGRLHSLTWLAWAVAAATTIQLAPSPVYVLLVIGVSAVVVELHAVASPLARAFPALIALGAVFGLVRVVLMVATTHGTGDVLFTLPDATLPSVLGGFTVGGTVELPVLFRALAEALAIVGMMAAFGAFNAVVSHHELLQAAPRSFYEPGLVVTVALAFVPSTIAAVTAAREADRARTGGRVVRRGRLLRQAVPILESGMERAVALAESMDARGFGHQPPGRGERWVAWTGAAALLSLAGALVALVGRAEGVAVALAAGGAVALVAAVVTSSRSTSRRRYRVRRVTRTDWALGLAAVAAPAAVGGLALLGDDTLRWSVEPLQLPGFNPIVAVAIALLLAPALRPAEGQR